MRLTPYHAKYIAHQLTRRSASDSVERLTAVLSDAQVDLNPHQVEAALFAFRNPLARGANLNPFQQEAAIIYSYQFARKMEPYLRQTRWDLVVIDEAHRLRNVYKPTNKIANSIKQSVAPFRKLLLTATPLQNSLLELYGLVSIIDDYTFGDLKTYRSRFTRLGNDNDFNDLKDRLRPICKRTLRRQVLEYVKYTNRHALVQEFVPTPEEQRLYDLVSEYLFRILDQTEFRGKVMVFNGTNTDPKSKAIYQAWLAKHAGTDRVSGSPAADMRAALVECFRDEAAVMIATEAAAEGINLQFCNLVVNYDLPWNPQRIEQRIGRCHRYGQKFDVVVVNFLNKANAADQRVYELLDEKFRLFSGVFGASDEVLGTVESGVDFEKRIAAIYQKCRTPEQIQFEFDQLQKELDTEIAAGQRDAREKLLDNFDQEVVEKVRIQTAGLLDRFNERLWLLTRYLLADYANFDGDQYSFYLTRNPFPGETIHPGPYRLGKNVEDANTYRVGHPLVQRVLAQAMALAPPPAEVVFDYSCGKKNIAALAPLVGQSGWLTCSRFGIQSPESEDTLILAAFTDSQAPLEESAARRLFDLPGSVTSTPAVPATVQRLLADALSRCQAEFLEALSAKNGQWFDTEMEKLDRWADDRRAALKAELEQLDQEIKETKKAARLAPNLPEKLELQRKLRGLETKRDEAWRAYDTASRDIDRQKDALLDEISRRLEQKTECKTLFTLRWRVT
jgi:hypothetical protein